MFKVLILATQNTVSDARIKVPELGPAELAAVPRLDLGALTPDENTIRLFREELTRAGAIDTLFAAFDWCLRDRG